MRSTKKELSPGDSFSVNEAFATTSSTNLGLYTDALATWRISRSTRLLPNACENARFITSTNSDLGITASIPESLDINASCTYASNSRITTALIVGTNYFSFYSTIAVTSSIVTLFKLTAPFPELSDKSIYSSTGDAWDSMSFRNSFFRFRYTLFKFTIAYYRFAIGLLFNIQVITMLIFVSTLMWRFLAQNMGKETC